METSFRQALHAWVKSELTQELPKQRWFRGKTRSIAKVELHDAFNFGLSDRRSSLCVLGIAAVSYADGGSELYQLPLSVSPADHAVELAADSRVWTALCRALVKGTPVDGIRGRLDFDSRLDEFGERAAAVESVELDIDQSNTSFVFGESVFGKVYRCMDRGESRESMIIEHLSKSDHGEFPVTPPFLGSILYRDADDAWSCAILSEFVQDGCDLWNHYRDGLDSGIESHREELLVVSQNLGETVAHMHLGLSHMDSMECEKPEAVLLRESLQALFSELADLRESEAIDLASNEFEALRDRVASMDILEVSGRPIPTHGDLHLGQVLRAGGKRLWILDFEGEPQRGVEERSLPRSHLKDVAGMLRSFSYARCMATCDKADLDAWEDQAREGFLESYWAVLGDASFCPVPELRTSLLAWYELEKLLYEILYEARQRPEFCWIPLKALRTLLDDRHLSS